MIALNKKDFRHAEEYAVKVFQIYRANYPETDRRTIVGLGNLATMYLRVGKASPKPKPMFLAISLQK